MRLVTTSKVLRIKGDGLLFFNGQRFFLPFEYAKQHYGREYQSEKAERVWIESTGIGGFCKKGQKTETAGGKNGEDNASSGYDIP